MLSSPTRDLPPGAYVGEDGRIYRDLRRFVGYETDPATGEQREVHELTPSEVLLTSATDAQGVWAAQRTARSRGLDFYHPQYGWLRRGQKREQEWPENVGETAKPRRRVSSAVTVSPEAPVERVEAAPVDEKVRRTSGAR